MIEVVEFGVINELDKIIGVVQDVIESQRQGDNVEMLERTVKRVEKRKREELGDIVENKIAKRRIDENIGRELRGER